MLRCIAIDDEELALELLEDNIRKVPFLELVATCSNPLEAIKVMQEQPIDLVFLDIQMPGLTGLQFIQSSLQNAMFILVTAYEKYALESYNLNVVDYLVKPVELNRFIRACNKAHELYKLKNKPADQQDAPALDYFFVNVDYSLLKVMYTDIIWIEGLKDYVKMHLKSSDKPIIARLSMKSLEEELPSAIFLRVHKSYIVSKSFVTAIRKNSVFIKDLELPIGENYKELVDAFTKKGGG
ncbi:MAG: response regulator transcription factor [Chitinophagaceae bacterium]|nr:MAG: response regulator transcription factor [Chitinophagaceae bacterium]